MCYEKPGPRCSGHTRTKYQETKMELALAEKDLAEKKTALDGAKSAKAKAELQTSQNLVSAARNAHAIATKNYDASKAYRATAMEAHREAKKEYLTSPEGIQKLRDAGKDAEADRFQKRRDGQLKAYKAVKGAEKTVEAKLPIPDFSKMTEEENLALAKDANSDSATLDALARSNTLEDFEKNTIHHYIAMNESADAQTLHYIASTTASNPDTWLGRDTLENVASNPATSTQTLTLMARGDFNDQVSPALVNNPNLPEQDATKLMEKYKHNHVFSRSVGRSQTAPIGIIEKIALRESMNVYRDDYVDAEYALKNPRLSQETLSEAYHDYRRNEVLSNENCPVAVMEDAVENRSSTYNMRGLLANENAPASLVASIAKNDNRTNLRDSELKYSLARNRHTPPETLNHYVERGDANLRESVASNPGASPELLSKMWKRFKGKALREKIENNPNFKG